MEVFLMTPDLETLRLLLLILLVLAAITTTAVPVVYSRFRWGDHMAGRLFMWRAIAFAVAFDFTVVFQFWRPHVLVEFAIDVVIFAGIVVTNVIFYAYMWKPYIAHKKGKKNAPRRQGVSGSKADRPDLPSGSG